MNSTPNFRLVQEARHDAHSNGAPYIPRTFDFSTIEQRVQQEVGIVFGEDDVMQQLKQQCNEAAINPGATLLLGEVGTGKEKIARYIGQMATYLNPKKTPYHRVNVLSFSPELASSELFGHEKGAFTGAMVQRKGLFERFPKGIIFLDEIGELKRDIQSSLLSVLEDPYEFARMGGDQMIKFDGKIITATNADLSMRIQQGDMRADFYSRLTTGGIVQAPTLAQRDPEHTRSLINYFQNALQEESQGGPSFSPQAIELLASYVYPDNVRGLRSYCRNAYYRALLASEPEVGDWHLDPRPTVNDQTGRGMDARLPESKKSFGIPLPTNQSQPSRIPDDIGRLLTPQNLLAVTDLLGELYKGSQQNKSETDCFLDALAIASYYIQSRTTVSQSRIAEDVKATRALVRDRLKRMAEILGLNSYHEIPIALKVNAQDTLMKLFQGFKEGKFKGAASRDEVAKLPDAD